MNIAVLGGGVVGLTTCHRLDRLGVKTTLFERADTFGTGVSAIALGGITPFSDDFIADKMGMSAQQVLRDFNSLISSLQCTESSLSYYDTGVLYLAFDQRELCRLEGEFSNIFPNKIRPKALSKTQILDLEPDVSREIVGGVLVDCEPSIDPSLLMKQLYVELCDSSNFTAIFGAEVLRTSDEGKVTYEKQYMIEEKRFDFIVVCTGADNKILQEQEELKMRGIKGQAALCLVPNGSAHGLSHHIYAHMPGQDGFDVSAYVVPRGKNAAIVGVTYEEEFLSGGNDVKGLSAFLNGIRSMLPVAKNWEVAELKSGIRPVSQDMGPLVGWKARNSKILVSIGHYGLGVTLAPFSANIIANAVGLTLASPEGASAFAPSRLK